jgi:hypothetical protein
MNTRSKQKSISGAVFHGLMAFLMCSCQSARINPGVKVSAAEIDPRPPAPDLIMLIETPRNIGEDALYPPGEVKQVFHWYGKNDAEWRFKLPAGQYTFAGFHFFKTFNVAHAVSEYNLTFSVRPASVAKSLWIGLLNRDQQPPVVLVDLPLSRYISSSSREQAQVTIPLHEFPASGTAMSQEPGADITRAYPFDWSDLAELRIISPGGQLASREVVVTDLAIYR